MTAHQTQLLPVQIDPADFRLRGDQDDLRVDLLCRELLMTFYRQLQADGLSPQEASGLASSADYYLRDFLLDRMRSTPFDADPEMVRRFAATWYIVNTLQPDLDELCRHLLGIRQFYRYLQRHQLISSTQLERLETECNARDFYGQRIDSFWKLDADGYPAWERQCPLPPGQIQR